MVVSPWMKAFKTSLKEQLANNKGEDAAAFVKETISSSTKNDRKYLVDKVVFKILLKMVRPVFSGGKYENYPITSGKNIKPKQAFGVYPYTENYRTVTTKDNLLHYAVRSRLLGAVQYLVAQHPDLIEEPNEKGDTPFHDAVSKNIEDSDVAALNIFSHFCENALTSAYLRANNERMIPLFAALSSSSPEVFKTLLQRYASIQDSSSGFLDTTPFHYAAQNPVHALHACEALLAFIYPTWGRAETAVNYTLFGDLDAANAQGETPLDLLEKQGVSKHQLLRLANEEIRINLQRNAIVKFSKENDLALLHRYIQAVSTYNYAEIANIIVELVKQRDNRLYMLSTMRYNVFSLIAQDRRASEELVSLFAQLPGASHQLFEFQETPMSVNRAAVAAIYKLRMSPEDLPISIAFHGIIDAEELATLQGFSKNINSLEDLFEYLKTEESLGQVASDSELRTKVNAYEKSLEAIYSTQDSSLDSVYTQEEVAQLAAMNIDSPEDLVDFLNDPLSFKVFDKQNSMRIKGQSFVENARINVTSNNVVGITPSNFAEVFSSEENDRPTYDKLKEQGATSASQVQEFLQDNSQASNSKSSGTDDFADSSARVIGEHLNSMQNDPQEHLVVTAETVTNKVFELEQFNNEVSQARINDYKNGFIAQSTHFVNAVNKGDFIDAFSRIYLSPSLIEFPTDSTENNIYHRIAKEELNTSTLLEFFNLPWTSRALKAQNIEGQTPLDVAELSADKRMFKAMEFFVQYNMNIVRLSYALDNGVSLSSKTKESIGIRMFIAGTIADPQKTQRQMDFAYVCSKYGRESAMDVGCSMHDAPSSPKRDIQYDLADLAFNYIAKGKYDDYRDLVETKGKNVVFKLRNAKGENAAHIAAKRLDSEAIELLSDLNFENFNAIAANGDRPLDTANRVALTKENRRRFKAFVTAFKEAQKKSKAASSSPSTSSTSSSSTPTPTP